MAGINKRLQRLEEAFLGRASHLCPDCGGGPVMEYHYPGARERYPFGPPCTTCGGGGGSEIRRIVIHQVDRRGLQTCEICDKKAQKDHRNTQ
jgi:hypothetical protein